MNLARLILMCIICGVPTALLIEGPVVQGLIAAISSGGIVVVARSMREARQTSCCAHSPHRRRCDHPGALDVVSSTARQDYRAGTSDLAKCGTSAGTFRGRFHQRRSGRNADRAGAISVHGRDRDSSPLQSQSSASGRNGSSLPWSSPPPGSGRGDCSRCLRPRLAG